MSKSFGRIECTPGTCGGAPRLKGRRINIFNIVSRLAIEPTEEVIQDYQVTSADVDEAVEYCRTLQCKVDNPEHFCDGCSLRRVGDDETFEEFLTKHGQVKTSEVDTYNFEDGGLLYLGDIRQLKKQWEGQDGWKLADLVANKKGRRSSNCAGSAENGVSAG